MGEVVKPSGHEGKLSVEIKPKGAGGQMSFGDNTKCRN